MSVFEEVPTHLLLSALVAIDSEEEAKRFLEDLLTRKEILSVSQRLNVARMLLRGEKYAEVEQATGASSATIVRVNQCIRYGNGGYQEVLGKLAEAQP
ncbi:MAG: hypothetical protein IKO22_06885 [Oscillospiraceae bacterium]|nr:hypothetical protein [Oscillospiraceae bacterium]